jgi:hypothetical protein
MRTSSHTGNRRRRGAAAAGAARGGAAGAPFRRWPQFSQKTASGSLRVPQFGQNGWSAGIGHRVSLYAIPPITMNTSTGTTWRETSPNMSTNCAPNVLLMKSFV